MTNAPERRYAPRYELLAQAIVASGSEPYLMTVRNISATGLFLEGDPADHPQLTEGVRIDLVLSASAPGAPDADVINVRCKGCVMRIEAAHRTRVGGFGITMEPATRDDALRMQTLLAHVSHVPPPRPGSLHAAG
jgi:hypothetical protein